MGAKGLIEGTVVLQMKSELCPEGGGGIGDVPIIHGLSTTGETPYKSPNTPSTYSQGPPAPLPYRANNSSSG